MRSYQVLVSFDGGARGLVCGRFASDWAAIEAAYEAFAHQLVLSAVPRRKGVL